MLAHAPTPHLTLPPPQVCCAHHQASRVERARACHQPAYRSASCQLRGHTSAGNQTPVLCNFGSILVIWHLFVAVCLATCSIKSTVFASSCDFGLFDARDSMSCFLHCV
jgi:hypothetical protein